MSTKHLIFILTCVFLSITFFSEGQKKVENIRATLKDLSPAERIEVLNRLSNTFTDDSVELSLEYLILAYEASIKLDDIETIIVQVEKIADLYTQLGRYDLANEYYNLSLNYAQKLETTEHLPRIFRLIGNVYYYMGEYDKCLASHMESLRYAELNKDEGGIAGAYNNIGLINMKYEKYDIALENYIKAEKMFAKIGSLVNQGRAIINIGNIYYFKQELDNALGYYQRAYNIFEKAKEIREIALAAQNISVIYDEKNDFENAVYYGEKALSLYMESNDVWGITNLSKNLGYHFLKNKNFKKSEDYFKTSLKYAQQTNSLPLLFGSYKALADLYQATEDYQNAYNFLKLEYSIADSLNLMETTEKLTELESKYQLDQKEQENKLVWRYFTYISILSVLVVLILLFNYRLKVRSNRQLKEKNIEIENQNVRLEEINATKNKFFSIIAHDLKNPLAAFIGFMEVIQLRISEMPKEELKENINQVSHLAESMLDLLENLLKWGRSQAGVIEFKPSLISILELVDNALRIVSLNAQNKGINLKIDIQQDIHFMADRNMLSTVIRNLLSNAIKFTPRGGVVTVLAIQENSQLKFTVMDTGIGISSENQKKLFRIDSQFRNHGTDREPGTGLGLILCKEFVERNGGSIFVNSTPSIGSEFGFTIPLTK